MLFRNNRFDDEFVRMHIRQTENLTWIDHVFLFVVVD